MFSSHNISMNHSDYIDQDILESLSGENYHMIPKEVEQSQIVDMHYTFDRDTNTTILIALLTEGKVCSFIIDENYHVGNYDKIRHVRNK